MRTTLPIDAIAYPTDEIVAPWPSGHNQERGAVLGPPVTGLPLSFVSYGGSNLIVSFMGIGLLVNIKLRKHAN